MTGLHLAFAVFPTAGGAAFHHDEAISQFKESFAQSKQREQSGGAARHRSVPVSAIERSGAGLRAASLLVRVRSSAAAAIRA